MGPFYCPLDHKVYLDLDFFETMRKRFHTTGDFAQAYVIAHEVGHHVQTLLGISEQMEARRSRASRQEGNALSVRMELQADCFAGVWAKRSEQSKQFLDPGDFESALNAASAIGDDTLQRQSQGHVVPDSFTHGSSAQRMRWLKRGFDTGDVQQCDTFGTSQL
jgi:predicted metalloprotease